MGKCGKGGGGGAKKKKAVKRKSVGGGGGGGGAGGGGGGGKKGKKGSELIEGEALEMGVAKIEYAKPKKPSKCKSCSGPIANGQPRVGDVTTAWAFEGLQVTAY